ncbi:MAG: SGNH/GDSL hydrolase family protein [Clostridia bacterium]|nr:SGNH/GDSL hydrolase family protein [Clostridia bacterium]
MKKLFSMILLASMLMSVFALTASATSTTKTVLDVKWNDGWAVISPNNCYNDQFVGDYEQASGFSSTDVFTVPKAGTKLTWTDPSGYAANSVLTVSSWKQENGVWVLDRDEPMYVGVGGDSAKINSIESVSSKGVTYSYVTYKDNENLRLCVKEANANFEVTAETTLLKGSWERAKAIVAGYESDAKSPVSLITGADINAEDISNSLTWNYGYVGSGSHSSYKNKIKESNYEYVFSDVLTVPKAGTTVYIFDGNSYASSNAAIFSNWTKSGNSWVFKSDTTSPDGYTANQQMVGDVKMYWYTTTQDNENLRMCVHGVLSDYAISIKPKVYMAAPVDVAKVSATGALTDASYVSHAGETVNYKIYLPTGYSADNNYKVLFDFSGNTSVADALVAAKTDAVIITANATVSTAPDIVDALATAYDFHPSFLYLCGSAEINSACKSVFVSYIKDTSGYDSALAAGQALLANHPDYYGILDGINMYAMGDSYFGGSSIGKAVTWVDQMGKKYDMDFINYGIGGSTMSAYVTDKNPMCVRYRTMERGDADVILLEGGRNDRSAAVPMGTNDSTDIKTFKGAVNTMLDGMLKTYPDAIIILVTAWYHTGKVAETGLCNVDYANALREIAEYRNNPRVICLYAADKEATGVNMDNASFRSQYCITATDVSHLNGAGMKMIQPYMEKFIAEALAKYRNLTVDGEPIEVEPEPVVTTTAEVTTPDAPENTEPEQVTTPSAGGDVTEEPTEPSGGCGGAVTGTAAIVALIGMIGCAVIKRKE